MSRKRRPREALTNDMWTAYVPRIIHEKKVTVLELICASTCLTSLIVMSLEERHGGQHLFQEAAHMLQHRVGARGNATCFLMPWQNILSSLADLEAAHSKGPDLPRIGSELVWG